MNSGAFSLISIGSYLYRKRLHGVIFALLLALLVPAASAQSRKKKEKGLRALALVEMAADSKAAPRIIPVAILDNGRFWDASVYLAAPRPLALEPGNVYEVERAGESIGLVVVDDAREEKDQWIGFGEFRPNTAETAGSAPTPSSARPPELDSDEPPVLRHPGSTAPAELAKAATKPQPESPIPPPSEQEDPNRPLLRRGKPASSVAERAGSTAARASSTVPGKGEAAPPQPAEVLAAISDAGGPEPRSYIFHWSPEEQQKMTRAVAAIASAEVLRYARNTPALKHAPAPTFDQTSARVFDLHFDNNPELVFTARVPGVPRAVQTRAAKGPAAPAGSDFYFYVTVVAQNDMYGQTRKLFSSVTDSRHLDSFPRLELIDAVDAEGTGRGNLLFRAVSRDGQSYQLYRVGPDSLTKLFDSAGK